MPTAICQAVTQARLVMPAVLLAIRENSAGTEEYVPIAIKKTTLPQCSELRPEEEERSPPAAYRTDVLVAAICMM